MRTRLPALLLCTLLPCAALADSPPAEKGADPARTEAEAAPAPADPAAAPPPSSTQVAAAEPPAEDPIVCKSTAKAGTRFATKSCMRKSDWAAMTSKAEEDFGAIRNRPVTCPECRG